METTRQKSDLFLCLLEVFCYLAVPNRFTASFVGTFCLTKILHCFNSLGASVGYRSTLQFLLCLFFVCFVVFKGTEIFVYNQDGSKESIRHKKIQSNLEQVLMCISMSAVILALILLTALR